MYLGLGGMPVGSARPVAQPDVDDDDDDDENVQWTENPLYQDDEEGVQWSDNPLYTGGGRPRR